MVKMLLKLRQRLSRSSLQRGVHAHKRQRTPVGVLEMQRGTPRSKRQIMQNHRRSLEGSESPLRRGLAFGI
jgi:hypothetical protein